MLTYLTYSFAVEKILKFTLPLRYKLCLLIHPNLLLTIQVCAMSLEYLIKPVN